MDDHFMRLVARERLLEAEALVEERGRRRAAGRRPVERPGGRLAGLRVGLGRLLIRLGRRLAGEGTAALARDTCRPDRWA